MFVQYNENMCIWGSVYFTLLAQPYDGVNLKIYRTILGDPQSKRVIRSKANFIFCLILMQNYSSSSVDKSYGPNCAGFQTTMQCCIHPLKVKVRGKTIERSHQASSAAEYLQDGCARHGSVLTGETSANELNN